MNERDSLDALEFFLGEEEILINKEVRDDGDS